MSSEDKLNELIPNIINFQAGERLESDKLNKLIEILNLNLEHIQGAVGDIYDVSGKETRNYWGKQFDENISSTGAEKRRFDIANLARLIGPASNLNPQSLGGVNIIKERIPLNVLEHRLKYPGLELNIATYFKVNDKESLVPGRFYYVEDNVIYFSAKTVAEEEGDTDLEVTYTTNPSSYSGGPSYQGAGFNVYPDPNQTLEKLEVNHQESVNGASTYTVNLPFITNQQGVFSDNFETTVLTSADLNFGNRPRLPEWIQEINDNEVIPRYSLYLKNYDTNESYIDATYTKINNTSVLITGLEIGNQECINNFDLRLITVGTDITTSIDDLRNKMFLHKHDGSFGEPKINIKDIVGFYEAQVEGGSGPYYPSSSEGNPISNYLHRDGYKANSDVVNGDNAMRGPLMMGLTDFDPITNRVIASDEEKEGFPIQFGSENIRIQRVNPNRLEINNIIGRILCRTEAAYLYLDSDTLNLNGGIKIKQLTHSMPHDVERINSGYQIDEMPYYKLMLKNPLVYTIPSSTTQFNDGNLYVDAFDIYGAGDNAISLGNDYSYPLGSSTDTNPEEASNRFKNFYKLETGSSDKGEFLNLNRGANDFTVEYYWGNKELNANLFFDLSRGTENIISPLYRLSSGSGYAYRAFEIHIFRGCSWEATLGDQLNDLSKKFSAEYQIQIDMDSIASTINPVWPQIPAIFLHYDYYKSTPGDSNPLGIENYLIDRSNDFRVFESDPNANTFFEDRNIRRVETPFNTLRDNLFSSINLSITNVENNVETTERINNYSTQSHSTLKINLSNTVSYGNALYTSDGEALNRFTLNIKEEFWNGVFTVGIS